MKICLNATYIKLISPVLYSLTVLIIVSCSKTDSDDATIFTPGGRIALPEEVSAGQSTIFSSAKSAYDTPADWVSGDLFTRFLRGDALYDDPVVSSTGLGPVYAGYSCASCHNNAGKTLSSLHTSGGSGPNGFSSLLTFIRSKNDQVHRNYGRVLHDQAIFGSQPEGKLHVTYTERTSSFPDGETYSLASPNYRISDYYSDSIPAEELVISVRTPLRHVGLGLMISIDRNEILQLAARSYPEYGISGKVAYVSERNQLCIGISGHKAQHADLTVELGFSSDMGVANDRYPHEVSEGQPQDNGQGEAWISTKNMADVELYLQSLGVPARRNVTNPRVIRGEERFYEAKCHLCHTPTLHTSQTLARLLDGTELKALAGQTIHPYSDFLLHDMGPELGDDYSQFNATGDEWRTPPLWGLGLQEIVNGHTTYLHDSRARNLVEAIMWHGGEGDVSRVKFSRMSNEEREELLQFLKSL
jgi:CxxC motif-containing protein (DUF1111 family)